MCDPKVTSALRKKMVSYFSIYENFQRQPKQKRMLEF